MFFFGEDTQQILRKQNLSSYVQNMIVQDKRQRKIMKTSKLIQVVTSDTFSDGVYDYPCIFIGEKFKKGSYLRLTHWQLNSKTFQFIIYQAQYLGGSNCEVSHGKKWDVQRIRSLIATKVPSKSFLILMQPVKGAQQPKIPQLNGTNARKAFPEPEQKDLKVYMRQMSYELQRHNQKVQQKLSQYKSKSPSPQKIKPICQQKSELMAPDNNIDDDFIGFLKLSKGNNELSINHPIEEN